MCVTDTPSAELHSIFPSTLIPWVIIIFSVHVSFLNPSVTGRHLAAGAKMRPNGTLAAYKSRTIHFCPFIAPHAFICSLTCSPHSVFDSFWSWSLEIIPVGPLGFVGETRDMLEPERAGTDTKTQQTNTHSTQSQKQYPEKIYSKRECICSKTCLRQSYSKRLQTLELVVNKIWELADPP